MFYLTDDDDNVTEFQNQDEIREHINQLEIALEDYCRDPHKVRLAISYLESLLD